MADIRTLTRLRDSLMGKTAKELRQLAKEEGICLGYAASCKASMVEEIASQLRYREIKEGEAMKKTYFALATVVILALSYGITAGLLWLVCLCFGWTWWSWQAALGVWLVLVIIKLALGRG